MAKKPSADEPAAEEKKTDKSGAPAPEVLKPQSDGDASSAQSATAAAAALRARKAMKRGTYRPSHKATFVGIAVVLIILAINAGVIVFVLRNTQNGTAGGGAQGEVTLSPGALDKLGVTRSSVGQLGTELVVGPNSRFNGKVTIGSDVSIGGQLNLNSKFSANDASLANLQAGNTAVSELNVNGAATASTLNLRQNLNVAGATQLQGPVTMGQLLTVNNNLNVSGNLSVGGTLAARNFAANGLTANTSLTVGGRIITRGNVPNIGRGPAVGTSGTVSMSGNDMAGTIAANLGPGNGNGIIARVAFTSQYAITPKVVVTPVGQGINGSVFINRTIGGFEVGISGTAAPGSYMFDYIVMQ
ncbi:hypothetical protein JNJ66_06445 [Candidatus Saccharibacteria bacterium]|nr:hypothetical protein [Candidatus Saccharibacteria bacterium]